MTRRYSLSRQLGLIARDGTRLGLNSSELAQLFLQEGLDHGVSAWGVREFAELLRIWADKLEEDPRKFRGEGYAWLDR